LEFIVIGVMIMDIDYLTSLNNFDFTTLFIEHLGWNHAKCKIVCDHVIFQEICEKCGVVVFVCSGTIPDEKWRHEIDYDVTQTFYEHLIIFSDKDQGRQLWQWVVKQPRRRFYEWNYLIDSPNETIIRKIQKLTFFLEEEDSLTVIDVKHRIDNAFIDK
jgi:hypothetical protein